ncbi:hypothetical protein [Neisseria chenwenguii]|uniref:hypothetical protein n=1 Tax=Neisseria chenwenguii TaxID=1853278 RepID=UPI000F50F98E|nr:hypothetical protein [Neisseria chenwenguii]ROV56093.1 hypothetical protein EGS38_06420 [Neisseria chenwenguii]
MKLPHTALILSAVLFAACGKEPETPQPDAPQNASAPAASAVPAADAAPENAGAASAAAESQDVFGALVEQERAKWQFYRCDDGKVEVRYFKGDTGPAAQVRYNGTSFTAPYSPELSNDDLSAFSNGEETWTVGNEFDNDYYKEGNGFLIKHEKIEGMGEDGLVDNTLVQKCMPETDGQKS